MSDRKGGKPSHAYLQALIVLANMFQLLSFVTADMATSPWPSSLSPFETLSSLTNLRGYKRFVSSVAVQAAVWVALLWVLVYFAALAWGVACFSKNSFPVMWPLYLLRSMMTLSSGLLFIPLLQILLTSSCALMFSSACTTYGFYGQLAVTILAAIFIIVMALLYTAVFYNATLFTSDFNASSTGRHSIVMLGLQVVLVLHGGTTLRTASCAS